MDGFPSDLRAILFDPEGHYLGGTWNGRRFETHRSWTAITAAVLDGTA